MKTASILCLISLGMLVSIFQQADSVGVTLDCYGKRMCGSECTVLPSMMFCSCSGPCTDAEIMSLMESGLSKTEAVKKMAEG